MDMKRLIIPLFTLVLAGMAHAEYTPQPNTPMSYTLDGVRSGLLQRRDEFCPTSDEERIPVTAQIGAHEFLNGPGTEGNPYYKLARDRVLEIHKAGLDTIIADKFGSIPAFCADTLDRAKRAQLAVHM
jgi:hypothetical protein